jgi:hypothetical protein
MAASVSGAKTTTVAVAPHLSTTVVNTLLSTAIENLTIAQFYQLADYLRRVPKGTERTSATVLGTLFA